MFKEISSRENSEIKNSDNKAYKEIKPDGSMAKNDVKPFWNKVFGEKAENSGEKLEKTLGEYFQDLKDKSDVPDTIPDKPFDVSELRKISPEENAVMREEFAELKKDLKQQWEKENGRSWPTYNEDVYVTKKNGERVKIREAGSDYDAHHIQPLGMGGKNEVSNITPLHADIHYDHRGVHEFGSPYDKVNQMLGGI